MALSLSRERSVTAGSSFNPVRIVARWIKNAAANRRRRVAMRALSELEPHLLHDLGITYADIAEARRATGARSPSMVLNAARARSAQQ
jgi:uncharacterized protein YjiS (DUF1127 family)